MNKIKPLTLEETRIKEEMKHNCFWDNIHYKNDNSQKAFELLCHLEDFEIQCFELQEENIALNKGLSKTRLRRDKYKRKYLKEKRKNKDLQSVIDKAIEFINENRRADLVFKLHLNEDEVDELLEILRGKE